MTAHFFAGTYSIAIRNQETGELTPLTSLATVKFDAPKESGEPVVYHTADAFVTWTVEFTADDWERLQWVLGIHWLWRKYRRTLN